MPPVTPPQTQRAPDGTGAAATGMRDDASRLPVGRRWQWWRGRAHRRRGARRAGQHRAAVGSAGRLRAAANVTGAVVLLAGLPWVLSRLAGSPLAGHWPGWQQTRELATSPLTGAPAVTALAGAAWLLWAVFAAAVIAEVTAEACGRPVPRLPAVAPVQALAAALAGTIVIAALHLPRTAARSAHPAHAALTAIVTTAAPLVPGPHRPDGGLPGSAGDRRGIAWLDAARAAGTSGAAGPQDRVHIVVAGDSLWDLALTYLGSGDRWHEIYDLNRGRQQPGGGTLTDPARIYPGWDLLIPAARPHPPHRRGNPPARPPAVASPGPGRSPHPAGSTPAAGPGTRPPVPPPGVRLPSGALIGLGTAAAVSTAVALACLHRRRRYRPGTVLTSSLRPAAPLAPVISALDRAARTPAAVTPSAEDTGPDLDLDLYEPDEPPVPGLAEAGAGAQVRHISSQPAVRQDTGPVLPGPVPIGIRDGQEITADPAALGGLGLTGPGAPDAARAILAGVLTRPPRVRGGQPARIIIPASDVARLLPGPAGQRAHPAIDGVLVPSALDAALDEAEAMIVGRARTADGDGGPQPVTVVMAAAPGPAAAQRLAGIAEAGRDLGVAVIVLAYWPHGTTCHITARGLISGVTPRHADLAGTEVYHLAAADLAAIITQLDQARGGLAAPGPPEPGRPHPPAATAGPGPGQVRASGDPAQLPPPGAGQGAGSGPAATPVRISVLGPLQITAGGRQIGTGLRKARELLAFLAVHGADGATGEAISEALWPGTPPGHGTRQRNIALRKARDLLRGATGLTAPMWITLTAGRYHLDPALVSADLWQFQAALDAARTADDNQARLAALRQAVACYRGPLADGAGYDWAEPYAETARRRALDAWARIAQILQPADPDQALAALEAALAHDPYNEYTYHQIMRLQAAAGRPDAVRRTLTLLQARLADLDLQPDAGTRQLAAALLRTVQPPDAAGGQP
jgi:DNA-binding SARP family transcriptional activator